MPNASAKLGSEAPPHGSECGSVCATSRVHQRGALGIQPLVEAEAGDPGDDRREADLGPGEHVLASVVAPGEQPVGEQHPEERHEERPEQEQERLVVPQVDEQRPDRVATPAVPAIKRSLRHLRQQILQRDGARVDVRERLVALVHGQREQREHARGPARGDRRQEPGRIADRARHRDHRAQPEERDRRHEVAEPRPPEPGRARAREAGVVGDERRPRDDAREHEVEPGPEGMRPRPVPERIDAPAVQRPPAQVEQ